MIYVFDVGSSEVEEDMRDYKACITNLANYSKNALVFLLIHKMDTIIENERKKVFDRKK